MQLVDAHGFPPSSPFPPLPSLPPLLPLPSLSLPQSPFILTLKVFSTDEAGIDIVVGEGDGAKLLKVKVKN